MKANNENDNNCYKAAEVKLMYMTKVKSSERIKIKNSNDAAAVFFDAWDFHTIEHTEEVKMLLLNRSNMVLGIASLSKGGVTGSIIDARVVLQYAINANASAVILAHNHPSGNLEASDADKKITRSVREALKLVSIELLDHLILNKDEEFATIET
ncbi:MAG: JAB domain-containing protein [Bacteroidota bacterium]